MIELPYVITIIGLGVDTLGNPQSSLKYTGINSWELVGVSLILILALRLFSVKPLLLTQKTIPLIFLITTAVASVFSIVDFLLPPNQLYSWLPVNYEKIMGMSLLSGVVWVCSFPNSFLHRHLHKIFFGLGVYLTALLLLMGTWRFDFLIRISREDSLIEYLQAITLLAAGVLSYMNTHQRELSKTAKIIFYLLGISFIMIAGDELSWGQRLLDIPTPNSWAQINTQGELTLHNLYPTDYLVQFGYLLISAYGLAGRTISNLLSHSKASLWHIFTPGSYLAPFFLFPFVLNLRYVWGEHSLGQFAEPAELFLYLGLLLFLTARWVDVAWGFRATKMTPLPKGLSGKNKRSKLKK